MNHLEDLNRRIADLERSRRWARNLVLLLTCLLVSVAAGRDGVSSSPAAGATPGSGRDILVAEEVHLRDAGGRLRVLISARAGISLLDEDGRPRAVLSLDASGPGLLLYGETSRTGSSMTVSGDGPAMAMRDGGGRTRILLAAIDDGPALLLSDENERERIALVQRRGQAEMQIIDATGVTQWSTKSR